MTPEGRVTAAIMRHLKALKAAGEPIWFVKLHGSSMQRAGLPDVLILCRGYFLAVEVKCPGKDATPLQRHTLDEMGFAGATCIVATCVDEVAESLRNLTRN